MYLVHLFQQNTRRKNTHWESQNPILSRKSSQTSNILRRKLLQSLACTWILRDPFEKITAQCFHSARIGFHDFFKKNAPKFANMSCSASKKKWKGCVGFSMTVWKKSQKRNPMFKIVASGFGTILPNLSYFKAISTLVAGVKRVGGPFALPRCPTS